MRRALLAAVLLGAALRAPAQLIPDEPGPVWDPAGSLSAREREVIADATLAAARDSGERFLVVVSAPRGLDSLEFQNLFSDLFSKFTDRNVFVAVRTGRADIQPTGTAAARVSKEAIAGFELRIVRRMGDPVFAQAVANVVTDYGATLAGHPTPPWSPWRHPRVAMGGGQDARPVNVVYFVAVILLATVVLLVVVVWAFTNPRGFLIWVGLQVLGGALGGSGGGGSSFSGGGGSSGGGGANGSW